MRVDSTVSGRRPASSGFKKCLAVVLCVIGTAFLVLETCLLINSIGQMSLVIANAGIEQGYIIVTSEPLNTYPMVNLLGLGMSWFFPTLFVVLLMTCAQWKLMRFMCRKMILILKNAFFSRSEAPAAADNIKNTAEDSGSV